MGLFQKLSGSADSGLLQSGVLGRGVILAVSPGRTTVQVLNGLVERNCEFRVEVTLDRTAPYEAVCKQRVQEVYIPSFIPGTSVVAVRVDHADLSRIVIDFSVPPPSVTVSSQPGQESAANVLENGQAARAVIVATQPLGMQNAQGVPMHAFVLTVMPQNADPYQVQVGIPTPAQALPLLFPGSNIPVKISTSNAESVVIDWIAALAPPAV